MYTWRSASMYVANVLSAVAMRGESAGTLALGALDAPNDAQSRDSVGKPLAMVTRNDYLHRPHPPPASAPRSRPSGDCALRKK